MSQLLARLLRLPPATTRARCDRDLAVPMRDGVELLADRWFPQDRNAPTVLVRSPYGRRSMFGFQYGRLFAERGFQVVVQSCRGTYGSGDRFDPLVHEADDAADTVAWLRAQPWFGGTFATMGASYLCFTQWALARSNPPELRAMVPAVGPDRFGPAIYPGGAFALDTALGFAAQVKRPGGSTILKLLALVWNHQRMQRATRELPLVEAYRRALGTRVPFFEEWLDHDHADDPYWARVDHSGAVAAVDAPVLLQGGWYDLFAADNVAQYRRLRDRGLRPHLTMGPWTHRDFGMHAWRSLLPETLLWLRAHLAGEGEPMRTAPVRVFVLGADEWREYDDWPPPGLTEQTWHLTSQRELATSPPVEGSDRFRYDPADPTPATGGPLLFSGAGPRDNRALEARHDVVVYTSRPLTDDLTVFDAPRLELHVHSTAPSVDVFARLCDVAPDGRSTNICDALVRITPDAAAGREGATRVELALSPTACRFRRGHRIRLQISGGAHPRFARNPGTGDPTATAVRLAPADQVVRFGPEHPSRLRLLRS